MTTFSSGMKILELNTSMVISKFSSFHSCFFLVIQAIMLVSQIKLTCSFVLSFRYIELVKKHGLEISQPGLEPNKGLTWQMTKRRGDKEVHK